MLRSALVPLTFALAVCYRPSQLPGGLQRREAMLAIASGGAAWAVRRPALAAEPDASASDAARQKEEAKERMRQKIEASKKNYRPASTLLDDRRARAADDDGGGKDEPRPPPPNGGIVEDL